MWEITQEMGKGEQNEEVGNFSVRGPGSTEEREAAK